MPIDHTIFTDQHRLGAAERALTSLQWAPGLNCDGLVWQPPLGPLPGAAAQSEHERANAEAFHRGVAAGIAREKDSQEAKDRSLEAEIAKRDDQIKKLQASELKRDNDALIVQINEKAARVKALEAQVANLKANLNGGAV